MENKLTSEVSEAIRKNLNGQVADELKTYLEKAQGFEADLEKYKAGLKLANENVNRLNKEVDALSSKNKTLQNNENSVNELHENVKERERDLKVVLAERHAAFADNLTDNVMNFMINMSKNNQYKKTITEQKTLVIPGIPANQYNCCDTPGHAEEALDVKTEDSAG